MGGLPSQQLVGRSDKWYDHYTLVIFHALKAKQWHKRQQNNNKLTFTIITHSWFFMHWKQNNDKNDNKTVVKQRHKWQQNNNKLTFTIITHSYFMRWEQNDDINDNKTIAKQWHKWEQNNNKVTFTIITHSWFFMRWKQNNDINDNKRIKNWLSNKWTRTKLTLVKLIQTSFYSFFHSAFHSFFNSLVSRTFCCKPFCVSFLFLLLFLFWFSFSSGSRFESMKMVWCCPWYPKHSSEILWRQIPLKEPDFSKHVLSNR